jgi:hypothetical protein
MVFAENRFPLFRIMLEGEPSAGSLGNMAWPIKRAGLSRRPRAPQ